MKKLLLEILLFTAQYAVAQDKTTVNIANPVYHALRESEQIECVKTEKNATTLYFCARGDAGTWEKFLSCSYLMDEQGKRHRIVGTKNIQLDKKTYLGKKRRLKFRVAFEPLPAGTKRFDLITDAYLNGGGGYYGIREKGLPLIAPNSIDTLGTYQAVTRVFPDSIFREDTVWLSGQIENYKDLSENIENLNLYLMKNYQNDANFKASKINIKVDSCGYFNTKIHVIGPYNTFMEHSPYPTIPILLYPGDHLKIRICALDKPSQHVVYESEKGDFNNFLNHCPVFYAPSTIGYTVQLDSADVPKTMDAVKKNVDEMDTLAQYIANKYAMTKAETQLLRSETNVNAVSNFIYFLNSAIHKTFDEKYRHLKNGYTTELLDSLKQIASHPCYRALSLLHADDNTFMVSDSYHGLFYCLFMSCMPPVIEMKQLSMGDSCKDYDSVFVNRCLSNDSLFADFICSYRGKQTDADKLFRQSFLLNFFIRGSEISYYGTSKRDVYARICAQKSRQITLPALQGLLKVAQKNFIER